MSELKQMEDGFGASVPSQALVGMRSQADRDISLMGWIDKLSKSVSIFAPGRAAFEQLLWDAKVHVIGHIATATSSSSSSSSENGHSMGSLSMQAMHPLQLLVLYLYTSHPIVYEQVNKCLVQWQQPAGVVWQPFVACLYQAIHALPPYEGECYRAVEQPYDEALYGQVGARVTWQGFTMASLQWNNCADLITKKRGMIFIIKSLRGRIVAPYAANPADSQTVFSPASTFQVTNHYVANPIALQQVNIREQTYKMFDFEKAKKQKACIIIELQEQA